MILLLPLIYLAAVLEIFLAPHWQIAGITPDLLALVAFTFIAISQSRSSIFIIALIGLASDLNSSGPLGLGLAAFALVAYSLASLQARLQLDHFFGRLTLVWLGITAASVIQAIVARAAGQTAIPIQALITRALVAGFYTSALAVPMLLLIAWVRAPQRPLDLTT